MKSLRRLLDNMRPSFEEGGKFEKFKSVFQGFETFLFVPNTVSKQGCHVHDSIDLKRTMSVVVMALVPCLLFGMWNAGFLHFKAVGEVAGFWQMFFFGFKKVIPIVAVSYIVGLGIEFAFAQSRKHEINEGFLVTGILIPLIMPINIPLWMVAVATAFAVIIGKEIFGGTGMNIWNPALLARAFIFFSYPSHISGDKVWVDGVSGATALAKAAGAAPGTSIDLPSVSEMLIGTIPGSIGETSKIAILIGALFLIFTGIGSWKIMFAGVLGTLGAGFLCNMFAGDNPYMALPPYYHLLMGGLAFGIVFMATDPVSAAQTEIGKWIYGFLIGFVVVIIRLFNPAYPEGAMLVILLLNTFAPIIDHYVVKANISKRLKRKPEIV